MFSLIKQPLKSTFLYRIYRDARLVGALKRWTDTDERMSRFYSQFIRSGDLCFDVGANIGNRVKVFLALNASVLALEPQKQCMRVLRKGFARNSRVKLIQQALGPREGSAEMTISESDVLSSLSSAWIEAVKKSGRFSQENWRKKQVVSLTTLDKLIDKHGLPSFIKIDVEGFEYDVLRGLTRPVPALSFEFTAEFREETFRCIHYLAALGKTTWNFSLGESMALALPAWVSAEQLAEALARTSTPLAYGDVYAKFAEEP